MKHLKAIPVILSSYIIKKDLRHLHTIDQMSEAILVLIDDTLNFNKYFPLTVSLTVFTAKETIILELHSPGLNSSL